MYIRIFSDKDQTETIAEIAIDQTRTGRIKVGESLSPPITEQEFTTVARSILNFYGKEHVYQRDILGRRSSYGGERAHAQVSCSCACDHEQVIEELYVPKMDKEYFIFGNHEIFQKDDDKKEKRPGISGSLRRGK